MTKEELIIELNKLNNDYDIEVAHICADELLIKFINDKEIKEAYENVDKWHA